MTLETLNLNDAELTGAKVGATSATATAKTVAQPAPGADDQKPDASAASAAVGGEPTDPETPGESKQETPEEAAERKKEKARNHERARLERARTAAADAKAEAKLLREQLATERAAKAQPAIDGEPKREDYPDYETYLRALTKHDARQEVNAAETKRAETQRGREQQGNARAAEERIAQDWEKSEAAFRATAKDYEERVTPFVEEELQTLHRGTRQAIVESDKGPALLYHLADPDNAGEVERIAKLSPVRQIAELGKLEDRLAAPAKRTTSAPAPATPVVSRGSGNKNLENMSIEETKAHLKSVGARYR